MTKRRNFLKTVGATGAMGLAAGCTNTGDGGDGGGGDGGDGGDEPTDTPRPYTDGELDMNVSPSVPQDKLEAQYAPIRDYLSEELGVNAKMNIAKNYSVVIQALGSGTSDLAETGPFAAALGVKADKADIILQRFGYGSWTYKSLITTHAESDIENLSDLKAEIESSDEFKIAFSDRLSTSGALYPLYNMSQTDISVGNLPEGNGSDASFTPVFAGGHTASFEQLANDQVDAACMGGFVRGIADNFDSEAKVIDLQEGLPRAPIVVSPELSDEEQAAIKEAFLNASSDIYLGKDGEEGTDDDLWFNKVREADVEKYQSVIDVANELDVGAEIFEG